jgi:outer membrane protein OmpA-like peptidoglycan-associated protein
MKVLGSPFALLLAGLTTVAGTSVARAQGVTHTLRIEGGVAIAATDPQVDLYDPGGGVGVGYELLPVPWLGIEARFSAFWMPSSAGNPTRHDYGTYYTPALALRIHPLATLGVGDLWLGAAGAVVFTGDVVRPGLEVGVGYEFEAAWWLRIGPYVRYHHVFQTERGADAGFFSVGLAVAFGGSEPPPSDRDGDGILDSDDVCADQPEDFDQFEDTDGCPDHDNDADGILDGDDACPNEAEDIDGFEDTNGCPDPDNDQDQILDGADQCRDEAEDRDGFQDDDGCPDPDNDGDGIVDGRDACPNEAETANGHEDTDGCPDVAPRTETELQLEQLGLRIQFAQNRAQVLPASRSALRAVIRLLIAHPEISRVVVEAHASSEGASDHNMELSRARGETVVAALVRGGIAPARVAARSFGEQRPDVAGTSEAELAVNRRVNFVVETQVPVSP